MLYKKRVAWRTQTGSAANQVQFFFFFLSVFSWRMRKEESKRVKVNITEDTQEYENDIFNEGSEFHLLQKNVDEEILNQIKVSSVLLVNCKLNRMFGEN